MSPRPTPLFERLDAPSLAATFEWLETAMEDQAPVMRLEEDVTLLAESDPVKAIDLAKILITSDQQMLRGVAVWCLDLTVKAYEKRADYAEGLARIMPILEAALPMQKDDAEYYVLWSLRRVADMENSDQSLRERAYALLSDQNRWDEAVYQVCPTNDDE